mmetsp:Transcript_9191/g.13605  ORF Transcript_9191/g.13605 Transcript_9191/m.13605 type:complete len:359 (+) Transcript_9191:42-1118(+)
MDSPSKRFDYSPRTPTSPQQSKRLKELRKEYSSYKLNNETTENPVFGETNTFETLLSELSSKRSFKNEDLFENSYKATSPPKLAVSERLQFSPVEKKRLLRKRSSELTSNRKRLLLSPEKINAMREKFHSEHTHCSFLDMISKKHLREKYNIYSDQNTVIVENKNEEENLSKKPLVQLLREHEEKMMVFDYSLKNDSPLCNVRRNSISNSTTSIEENSDNPYVTLYNSPLSDKSTNWVDIQLNIEPVDDHIMKAIAKNEPLPQRSPKRPPVQNEPVLSSGDMRIPSLMMPLAKDQYQSMLEKHAEENSKFEEFIKNRPIKEKMTSSGFKLFDDMDTADSISSLESSLQHLDQSNISVL